jgi:hypothetical protein
MKDSTYQAIDSRVKGKGFEIAKIKVTQ